MAKKKIEKEKQEKFYVSFSQNDGCFGVFERKNHPVTGAGYPAKLASTDALFATEEEAQEKCDTLNGY